MLYAPLLDIGQLHIFALSTQAVAGVAIRLGDGALPLVEALMPLLIDLSQSTGAASAVGGHAHCAVCAVLPRVSSYDAIPPLLSALDRSTASSVARARSTEQLLLALSAVGAGGGGAGGGGAGGGGGGGGGGSGSGGSGGSGGASNALRGKRAASIASVLCARLHDPNASTRRLARHALLVLMEASPRVASEPFATLPLRTQRQLTSVAKCRAAPIGPPLLPPPPPPPPYPQATLIQAVARGRMARKMAAAAAAFVSSLSMGDRLMVYSSDAARLRGGSYGHLGGHLGTLRYRGNRCDFAPGLWLGIELDLPVGRCEGVHQGTRYFPTAQRRAGIFVRPSAVAPIPRLRPPAPTPPTTTASALRSAINGASGGVAAGAAAGEAAAAGETRASSTTQAPSSAAAPAPPPPHPADALTPGPPRATNDDAPATKQLPMKTLVESHKRALASLTALCDGQNALVRATELACRVGGGEAGRAQYLQQMEILCMQQKLIASQMVDAIQAERAAAAAAAPGRE